MYYQYLVDKQKNCIGDLFQCITSLVIATSMISSANSAWLDSHDTNTVQRELYVLKRKTNSSTT
jgi:hypothetical protein